MPGGWKFDAKDITGLLEGLLFFFLNLNLLNLFLLLLLWYLLTCCSYCNNISYYFCDFREICELLQGFFINLNFFGPKFRKNLPANAILDISAPICTVSSISSEWETDNSNDVRRCLFPSHRQWTWQENSDRQGKEGVIFKFAKTGVFKEKQIFMLIRDWLSERKSRFFPQNISSLY